VPSEQTAQTARAVYLEKVPSEVWTALFYSDKIKAITVDKAKFEVNMNGTNNAIKDGIKERRFKTYNAMEIALRKIKMRKPGAVATLLLEAFLEDGGRIPASKAVSREICNEGEFSAWRKQLIEKGWLIWSESQSDKGLYFPGKKLMPYVNKEKFLSREIVTKEEVLSKDQAATKRELEAVKKKLDATEARVSTIENSMKKIYKNLDLGEPDPPGYNKLHVHLVEKPN
jgi:hypothetical protein